MNRSTIHKALNELNLDTRWIHKDGIRIQAFSPPAEWEWCVFKWNEENSILNFTQIWLCRRFLIFHDSRSNIQISLKFNEIESFTVYGSDEE